MCNIVLAQLKFPQTGKYLYADANNYTLDFSSGDVSDANNGALAQTLQQTYGGSNATTGWIFYNDEPSTSAYMRGRVPTRSAPLSSSVEYGHSKGVVGWDASGGYWIVVR